MQPYNLRIGEKSEYGFHRRYVAWVFEQPVSLFVTSEGAKDLLGTAQTPSDMQDTEKTQRAGFYRKCSLLLLIRHWTTTHPARWLIQTYAIA